MIRALLGITLLASLALSIPYVPALTTGMDLSTRQIEMTIQ